jgi:hypothetical protein
MTTLVSFRQTGLRAAVGLRRYNGAVNENLDENVHPKASCMQGLTDMKKVHFNCVTSFRQTHLWLSLNASQRKIEQKQKLFNFGKPCCSHHRHRRACMQ